MKKFWIIIVIIIIIVVAIIINKKSKQKEVQDSINTTQNEAQSPDTSSNSSSMESTNPSTSGTTSSTAKTVSFTINGGNFYFKPNVMKVKLGDTVNITFTNDEGMHDFKIDEFAVATDRIGSGVSTTASFVANKKGTFQYYCSVGQHRANGMWGTLTVE